jgi:replicative DNA helicase
MELCDPAAERATLACLAAYGAEAYADVADMVNPGSFVIDSNQILYRCFQRLLEDGKLERVDVPSILSTAHTLGLSERLDRTDEQQHLRAIFNTAKVIGLESARRHAAKVAKLEVARECRQAHLATADDMLEVTGDENIDTILGKSEGRILELSSRLGGDDEAGPHLMGRRAREFFQYLKDNPRASAGIPTCFPRWDRAIGGGLRKNGMDLIGARQKSGKSFIVDNVGVHVARQGIDVINVDTEMTEEEHLLRVAAAMAGVPSETLELGAWSAAQQRLVDRAITELEGLPYHYMSVIGMSFEDILSRLRRWVVRKVGRDKPFVVLYDYIKLMDSDGLSRNLAEHQVLGFIASSLKNLMGRFNGSCLALAQLNRDGIDHEDARTIRGSDRILDAVTSFTIYRWLTPTERSQLPPALKQYTHKFVVNNICRHGRGLAYGDFIYARADYEHGRIIEGPLASEANQPIRGMVVDDPDEEAPTFG